MNIYQRIIKLHFLAQRIKQMYPEVEVHVAVTLRNQLEAIESMYSEAYLRHIRTKPETFYRKIRENRNFCFLNNYYYLSLLDFLSGLFGRESLHVNLFEEMKHDTEAFSQFWARTLGARKEKIYAILIRPSEIPRKRWEKSGKIGREKDVVRPLFGPLIHKLVALKNRVTQKSFGFARLFIKRRGVYHAPMDETTKEKLREYYQESNRKLAEEYQLPLSTYGYPL